jgi:hypothetical protein
MKPSLAYRRSWLYSSHGPPEREEVNYLLKVVAGYAAKTQLITKIS